MKKWTTLERAATPDGKTLTLEEHDGAYAIRVDGVPLMSTRQHTSEERLAELACGHLRNTRQARVLIGGLGFGFTLKAALSALASDAQIVMAELLEAVIAWNRNPKYGLAAGALSDLRVTVVLQDVSETIAQARTSYDAIILDVDNGPAALSADGNGRLYGAEGLRQARAALRPGGCAAYWSVAADAGFEREMERAGFRVEVEQCRAHGKSGRRHTLYVGRAK
jgi:spermidine synthase